MIEKQCDPASPVCRWVIRPNCSLTWHGAVYIYTAIFVVCTAVAVIFALHGFWPVLPFTGLELLVLGAGLYLSLQRGEDREVVTLDAETIIVEKGRYKPRERWEFPRAWARVLLERPRIAWYPSCLAIGYQGKRVEVGQFLNEMERKSLAKALEESIHSKPA